MDEQKKQKVLVGILAVLILGAGSVWYMSRDDSSSSQQNVESGPAVRKQRKQSTQTVKKIRKKREQKASKTKTAVVRKQRDDTDRSTATRKKRVRRGDKKIKKEKLVPAA